MVKRRSKLIFQLLQGIELPGSFHAGNCPIIVDSTRIDCSLIAFMSPLQAGLASHQKRRAGIIDDIRLDQSPGSEGQFPRLCPYGGSPWAKVAKTASAFALRSGLRPARWRPIAVNTRLLRRLKQHHACGHSETEYQRQSGCLAAMLQRVREHRVGE